MTDKKSRYTQAFKIILILIIPSLFYVVLSTGNHDIARLPYYGVEEVEGVDTVYHVPANFAFESQKGDSISWKDLRGKVVVINQFCAKCSAQSHRVMSQIAEIANHFDDKEDVVFLSMTKEPQRDSAIVREEYREKLEHLGSRWYLGAMDSTAWAGIWSEEFFANELAESIEQNPDHLVLVLDQEGYIRARLDGIQYLEKRGVEDAIKVLRFKNFKAVKSDEGQGSR